MTTRLLEMRGIVKHYGAVRANDGIDLDVAAGQIVGLLGENGSGKSTLMKVLFGMVEPDGGAIVFRGRELRGHRPRDAMQAGIDMVHQHFMLVEAMTVADNVMLGWPQAGRWLRKAKTTTRIREASEHYGLGIAPLALVETMSFGARQRVEILKAILRGADLVVLDEPTSNLGPSEVDGLIGVMRRLREEGKGIIFISHKLGEVMSVCDEVVVLRDGKVAGRKPIAATDRNELANFMIGRNIAAPLVRHAQGQGDVLLSVRDVSLAGEGGRPLLANINLEISGGEVVAIAGVDGNGQLELVEAIAGMRRPGSGSIRIAGRDVTSRSAAERIRRGLSFVPPDRASTSLVPDMSIAENLALRDVSRQPFSHHGFLSARNMQAVGARLVAQYAIRAPGPLTKVRTLSGGNQQKIVVAREIDRHPQVFVAFQATWGLDPGATRFVLEQVLALRAAGAAVLYVSTELDELLAVGDRIGVLHNGRLSDLMARAGLDMERIGLLMSGSDPDTRRDAA